MKELIIYECGAMSNCKSFEEMNGWRVYLKTAINKVAENVGAKVKVINPCDYYRLDIIRHQSETEVFKFDLSKVKESDLVVVNLEGLNTSIGSIIECYEAFKRDIPVLAFGSNKDYETLHPWVQCCITRHDKNYRECINYIRDFYMT